jgi:histone H3/H4
MKKTERSTLTRGGIRRLARRGGIKRISDGVYSEVRDFVDYFLNQVVKDSAIFA